MAKFSFKYLYAKLMQALRQGITPRKLAVTCSLGIVIGLFPVFGITTLLCLGVAIMFRLNIPVIQIINYLVAPLQLVLMLPFIKIGTYVFNLNPFPYTFDELSVLFRTDLWLLLKEAGIALLIGIGVWALIAVPLFFILFYASFWFFSQWKVTRYREL